MTKQGVIPKSCFALTVCNEFLRIVSRDNVLAGFSFTGSYSYWPAAFMLSTIERLPQNKPTKSWPDRPSFTPVSRVSCLVLPIPTLYLTFQLQEA